MDSASGEKKEREGDPRADRFFQQSGLPVDQRRDILVCMLHLNCR